MDDGTDANLYTLTFNDKKKTSISMLIGKQTVVSHAAIESKLLSFYSLKKAIMKKAPVKPQKVIGSKISAKDILTFNLPPLTAKQKKVLQSPPKPPMKRIIVAPAPTKPRTLATFSSIPELKKTLLKKSTTAKLYLMYNKITKQYWWRSVGLNGEILANSEQMHNKADVKHNAALHFDLF